MGEPPAMGGDSFAVDLKESKRRFPCVAFKSSSQERSLYSTEQNSFGRRAGGTVMLLPALQRPGPLLLKELSEKDFGARCCGFPPFAPNNTALRMGPPRSRDAS
jgi:hypothetical protein